MGWWATTVLPSEAAQRGTAAPWFRRISLPAPPACGSWRTRLTGGTAIRLSIVRTVAPALPSSATSLTTGKRRPWHNFPCAPPVTRNTKTAIPAVIMPSRTAAPAAGHRSGCSTQRAGKSPGTSLRKRKKLWPGETFSRSKGSVASISPATRAMRRRSAVSGGGSTAKKSRWRSCAGISTAPGHSAGSRRRRLLFWKAYAAPLSCWKRKLRRTSQISATTGAWGLCSPIRRCMFSCWTGRPADRTPW